MQVVPFVTSSIFTMQDVFDEQLVQQNKSRGLYIFEILGTDVLALGFKLFDILNRPTNDLSGSDFVTCIVDIV